MEELKSFLAVYSPNVQQTMLEGRDILLSMLAPVGELHYDATSAVCIGFSYAGDVKGLFVNLAAYSKHVTLAFAHGAKLLDSHGILKGEENQVRHIRLTSAEDLREAKVIDLIQQATFMAPRPKMPIAYGVTVKVYAGPKRRPLS